MSLSQIRHRLLVRLLAAVVPVALCSITATAWLAAQSTSGAIRREQGQVLADDARINDALLGYAATHPGWEGVAPVVGELARRTGRRIALTTEDRGPIADSAASGVPLPARASAVVDPLRVDVSLVPGASADRIDPRAVAPFGLSAAERARLREAADRHASCLRRTGQDVQVTYGLSGRPTVELRGPVTVPSPMPLPAVPEPSPTARPAPYGPPCPAAPDGGGTPAENAALRRLNDMVNACLADRGMAEVRLALDGSWTGLRPDRAYGQAAVSDCIATARRAQLKPFVAPAALLFLGDPGDGPAPGVELNAAGVTRIVTAALVVLVLAVGVSAVIATRLVRPVHALTDAAQRMREGDVSARVRVRDEGEIGRLAAAFNAMSEHLERVERQRREMIGDISHELRTPLSNVRGWLEAAHDGVAELDPALISSLVEEILLLQHIVDDLQELALADAGALRLHPEPGRAAEILEQIVTAHRSRAEAAGLRIDARVEGDPRLLADPVRLRQVIGNLVNNALRYTPPGGRVTLRARRDGRRVLIEVADTGAGIAADDLPHVFDRFWRADRSRSRSSGGSGLGLAIVRSLVEAQGGTAAVSSAPGAGTVFTLSLPAAPGGDVA